MEDPRKNDDSNKNKRNSKIMPAVINMGAGSFGMGGMVLFGAGLVAATLVSALAFKTRRQRRSSSEISKSRSPSPETQTVNAPNQLESMTKTSKDSSADSLPLNLPNSSDEVTSMKEIQTKNIQILTLEEKHNSGFDADEQVDSGDSKEDGIFSVVSEDQKNTLICVDSVSEKLDNVCEEIVLDYDEEQAVMVGHIESGTPTSEEDSSSEIIERDEGGEQKKYLMLTDNELEEQVDIKLLISNEVVASIEEYEAIEVGIQMEESMPLGDDVAVEEEEEDEDIPIGRVGEGRETVFMNEEASYVNQIKIEDNPQVQLLEEKQEDGRDEFVPENSEDELIEEVDYADQTVGELVIEEEVIDAACGNPIEVENGSQGQFVQEERENDQLMQYDSEQVTRDEEVKEALEDILEIKDHEVALHAQELHLNDNLKVSVGNQTDVKEDNPPTQLINEEEKYKETEEMITENEMVKKDEIPNGHTDEGLIDELVVEEEAIDAACVHQIEEQDFPQVQFVEEEKENDQELQYDSKQIMVKEAIKAACVDSVNVEDIMEMTDHEVALNAEKIHLNEYPSSTISCAMDFNDSPNMFVDVKEDLPPTQLMNKEEDKETEDEVVMKDEIPHVQSIEEDGESEETELSSDEFEDSSIEELTPEKVKISNHKIQENMEEKQTFFSKNQSNRDHNGIIEEDKGRESASRELELAKGKKQVLAREPWNLKLLTWSILISIWCLCHWYFELPFPEVSLAGCLLFILTSLCYRNRTAYKYE